MRVEKLMVGLIFLVFILSGDAWAKTLSQTVPVQQTASARLSYVSYDAYADEVADDSPSDALPPEPAAQALPPEPAAQALPPEPAVQDAEENPLEADAGVSEPAYARRTVRRYNYEPQPWKLPQPYFLQKMGIGIGGWLEQGITFNDRHPANGFNGPVGLNDLDGEYQMNQLWLFLDRPANNGGYGWALGGHVDMLYGTDFRFGINEGLEDRINALDGTYGMVIPQAYVEVAVNDLSVKLGHFAGILDYEAVPTVVNPFYSHSLCYAFTVPQLVTGALADYKLTDQWSIQGGFHRGWMKFEDNNDSLDFMGGVKWTSRDSRSSLAFALSSGPQYANTSDHNRFVYSLVLQHQLTERFKYVLVHNLGTEEGIVQGQDAEWYGLNQYFLYQINPRWAANFRFEWLRDDDGIIVHGPPAGAPIRAWPWPGAGSYVGDFYEFTAGLSWKPCPNLIVRPECRWDWFDGTGLPYNNDLDDAQFTFGVDAIITY